MSDSGVHFSVLNVGWESSSLHHHIFLSICFNVWAWISLFFLLLMLPEGIPGDSIFVILKVLIIIILTLAENEGKKYFPFDSATFTHLKNHWKQNCWMVWANALFCFSIQKQRAWRFCLFCFWVPKSRETILVPHQTATLYSSSFSVVGVHILLLKAVLAIFH